MSYVTLPVAGTDVYVSGKELQAVGLHDMSPSCKAGTGVTTSGCCIIVTLEPWNDSVAVDDEVLWSMLSIAAVVKTSLERVDGTTAPDDLSSLSCSAILHAKGWRRVVSLSNYHDLPLLQPLR